MERSRSPIFRRLASGSLLVLLVLSFVLVFNTPPVQASSAVVDTAVVGGTVSTGSNPHGINQFNVTVAVAKAGDIVILSFQIENGGRTATSDSAQTIYPNSLGDNQSNVWAPVVNLSSSPLNNCYATACTYTAIWAATMGASGHDLIKVGIRQVGNISDSYNGAFALEAYDTAGLTLAGIQTATQGCLAACGTHIATYTTGVTVPLGGLAVASLSNNCDPSCALNPGTGFTAIYYVNGGTGANYGAAMYSTTGFSNPTFFPWTQSVGEPFQEAGAVFYPSSAQEVTTVINTMEQNPSGGNGTYNYIARGTLYYYPSQNVATTSTMNNVTLKIGPIYINSTIGTFYLLTYTANGPPSPSNPWTLINTISLPVYNNTSLAYFVHRNPQSSICPSCYYMEAIMAATGHSNSASVTGSGVKVEEIALPSETENYYTIHSITPPVNFYSSSLKSEHFDWIYTNLIFTVATITTTVSSTLTTGAATVTTTINQAGIQTNVNLYLAIAIIGGLFLIMTKVGGIAGAMFGAIIGEIICIVGGIITGGLADVSLVATVVGCLAMIYMGRSSGGGGGV